IGDVRRRRVVRRIRADAYARRLGQEDSLDGHLHEIAFELPLDVVARPWRQLAGDLDAVTLAELRPKARGNQVERVLAQRRALDPVQCAFVGAAVLLEAALQQDGERGLAAG